MIQSVLVDIIQWWHLPLLWWIASAKVFFGWFNGTNKFWCYQFYSHLYVQTTFLKEFFWKFNNDPPPKKLCIRPSRGGKVSFCYNLLHQNISKRLMFFFMRWTVLSCKKNVYIKRKALPINVFHTTVCPGSLDPL